MKAGHLDKIKSRSYWRINFQPFVSKLKLSRLSDCKDIVAANSVSLRGWDYPHIPKRLDDDNGLAPGENFYESWSDWGAHIEFWRMYQSGQFIHYLALREDWVAEDPFWGHGKSRSSGKLLGVTGTVFQATEIFELLRRISARGIYDEGCRVSITLFGTTGRKLWIDSPNRFPFSSEYKCSMDSISFEQPLTREQQLGESRKFATDLAVHVFERFAWEKPNLEMIRKDQEDLLKGL